MEVRALCPLVAWGFVWQWSAGRFGQTVVVKATFRLAPDRCQLADVHDALVEDDVYAEGDPRRSLMVPSDKVPHKPHADVMLVGHAYAPKKQPVRSLMARLVVGSLDKSIEVWCDRGFRLQDGQLREGPRFSKMPLCWERAAGGPETSNPVGIRFDAEPDAYGLVTIPNLQPPGMHVSQRSDTFAPVCFAPISATWPSRTTTLGRLAGTFSSYKWDTRPIPDGLDFAYFQAAPPDQQIAAIRPNERIILENLHPDHPRLVTSLPELQPKVVAERGTGERENVTLSADTLRIDTDRGVCVVVWRGTVWLSSATEAGRIVVTLDDGAIEELDESDLLNTIPPTAAKQQDVQADDAEDLAGTTLAPGFDMLKVLGPVMPFLGQDKPQAGQMSSTPETRLAGVGLPFGNTGGLAGLRAVDLPPPVSAASTIYAPIKDVVSAPAIPASSSPSLPVVPPPVSVPAVVPPPMVTAPPMVEPIAPATGASAWAAGLKDNAPAPTMGQMMAQAQQEGSKPLDAAPVLAVAPKQEHDVPSVIDEAAAKRGWKPVTAKAGDGSKGPPLVPNAVLMGAAAASDAAAGDRPKGTSERRVVVASAPVIPPKAVIELLWFDPAAMPRIRRNAGWKEILGQIKSKAFEDELSGDSPPEKRQEARDKRDVAGLLARGDATDMAGLNLALANAVTEDGTFIPPLVLLAGDLEFPFDELETLKATMAALTPLASGDKPLKEQLDTTEELLKTPWLKGASGIAEGLTAKLKEVYGRGNRVLPPRYLEGHTERMLLEQRAYQKRTVLGKTCIRSLLHMPGVQGGIPVYLPEALGQELPAFQRFAVRMIGEVRGRVDQYEAQDVAVRGVGVGRAIPGPARRS